MLLRCWPTTTGGVSRMGRSRYGLVTDARLLAHKPSAATAAKKLRGQPGRRPRDVVAIMLMLATSVVVVSRRQRGHALWSGTLATILGLLCASAPAASQRRCRCVLVARRHGGPSRGTALTTPRHGDGRGYWLRSHAVSPIGGGQHRWWSSSARSRASRRWSGCAKDEIRRLAGF